MTDHLPPNDQAIHDSVMQTLPTLDLAPLIRAVYFLIREGRVIYVGQTEHLVQRITYHEYQRKIVFDEVRYLEMPTGNLNVVEREFICRLNPECNGALIRGKPHRKHSINRNILSQNLSAHFGKRFMAP